MRLQMRYLGDPILRTKADPVAEVTDEIRALVSDMFETMYAEDGVGLAAPQIGVSQRIIVVDPRNEQAKPFALVNPEIVEASQETEKGEEGCLSLPGLNEMVDRSVSVVVTGMNEHGEPVKIEAEGLLARILQHEVDHVDGILFIDRISPLKRKMRLKRWGKVKP